MGSDSLLTLGIAVMIGLSLSAVEDEGRWRPDELSVSVVLREFVRVSSIDGAALWEGGRSGCWGPSWIV